MSRLFSLLIAGFLFSSFSSRAQYMPATYWLVNAPNTARAATAKVNYKELLIRVTDSKTVRVKPAELLFVSTADKKKYIPSGKLIAHGQFGDRMIYQPILTELVDSGTFCLTRVINYANQRFMLNSKSGSDDGSVYMVKAADSTIILPGYVWTNKGKKLCDALQPYVITRPDLQQVLNDRQIRAEDLSTFFRALNSGQIYPSNKQLQSTTKKSKEHLVEDPFGN